MLTLLHILIVVSFIVWVAELYWIYQQARLGGEDALSAVSGAAIFWVLALPVAQRAPDLTDRLAAFWDRLAHLDFGGQREEPVPRLMVQGRAVPLTEERVRIGRYPNNDIIIDHPTVSAYHAEVSLRPDGRHELVDRESRNGTRINGNPVRSAILRDGDQITLGAITLHYLVRAPSERTIQSGLSLPKRRLG
ncbi:MAG TPA: FHA domain-containing protein [Nitrolancea sp.]|nr:FHA domain-containing protein [Nitrolancea sp.]